MINKSIRLLVVEDHAMVRKALKALLNEYEGFNVIGEAVNGLQAIELVKRLKPDVVLADLLLPDMDGIETIRRMIAIRPDQRILVLTAYLGDDKLLPALKAGARGYLRKDLQAQELVQSIRTVYTGEQSLSPSMACS